MVLSEKLNETHDSKISPEVLARLDNLKDQVDPKFEENLEEYRFWVLKLLSDNAAYADHP